MSYTDIQNEIQRIRNERYAKDVRDSIANAISGVNNDVKQASDLVKELRLVFTNELNSINNYLIELQKTMGGATSNFHEVENAITRLGFQVKNNFELVYVYNDGKSSTIEDSIERGENRFSTIDDYIAKVKPNSTLYIDKSFQKFMKNVTEEIQEYISNLRNIYGDNVSTINTKLVEYCYDNNTKSIWTRNYVNISVNTISKGLSKYLRTSNSNSNILATENVIAPYSDIEVFIPEGTRFAIRSLDSSKSVNSISVLALNTENKIVSLERINSNTITENESLVYRSGVEAIVCLRFIPNFSGESTPIEISLVDTIKNSMSIGTDDLTGLIMNYMNASLSADKKLISKTIDSSSVSGHGDFKIEMPCFIPAGTKFKISVTNNVECLFNAEIYLKSFNNDEIFSTVLNAGNRPGEPTHYTPPKYVEAECVSGENGTYCIIMNVINWENAGATGFNFVVDVTLEQDTVQNEDLSAYEFGSVLPYPVTTAEQLTSIRATGRYIFSLSVNSVYQDAQIQLMNNALDTIISKLELDPTRRIYPTFTLYVDISDDLDTYVVVERYSQKCFAAFREKDGTDEYVSEFVPVSNSGSAEIKDGSVTESKLSSSVREKLNNLVNPTTNVIKYSNGMPSTIIAGVTYYVYVQSSDLNGDLDTVSTPKCYYSYQLERHYSGTSGKYYDWLLDLLTGKQYYRSIVNNTANSWTRANTNVEFEYISAYKDLNDPYNLSNNKKYFLTVYDSAEITSILGYLPDDFSPYAGYSFLVTQTGAGPTWIQELFSLNIGISFSREYKSLGGPGQWTMHASGYDKLGIHTSKDLGLISDLSELNDFTSKNVYGYFTVLKSVIENTPLYTPNNGLYGTDTYGFKIETIKQNVSYSSSLGQIVTNVVSGEMFVRYRSHKSGAPWEDFEKKIYVPELNYIDLGTVVSIDSLDEFDQKHVIGYFNTTTLVARDILAIASYNSKPGPSDYIFSIRYFETVNGGSYTACQLVTNLFSGEIYSRHKHGQTWSKFVNFVELAVGGYSKNIVVPYSYSSLDSYTTEFRPMVFEVTEGKRIDIFGSNDYPIGDYKLEYIPKINGQASQKLTHIRTGQTWIRHRDENDETVSSWGSFELISKPWSDISINILDNIGGRAFSSGTISRSKPLNETGEYYIEGTYQLMGNYCHLTVSADKIPDATEVYYKIPFVVESPVAIVPADDETCIVKTDDSISPDPSHSTSNRTNSVIKISKSSLANNSQMTGGTLHFTMVYKFAYSTPWD